MTERNEPVDRRHEEALSNALHAHAGTVRPAGDGLVRIRARVERRRRRFRFLAPLASLATAAAAVTAIVASGLFTSTPKTSVNADESTSHPAVTTTATTQPAAVSSSAVPSTTPPASKAPATSTEPAVVSSATLTSAPPTTSVAATGINSINPPVWPFADAAAAMTWQQTSSQKTEEAWHLDPRNVAERFASTLVQGLGLPHFQPGGSVPVVNDDGTATVDLTRTGLNGSTLVLGTVHLSHWTTGADAPWGVVSITSPAKSTFPLTITSPTPFAAAVTPLAVTWTLVGGAEDDDYVGVWPAGATSPASSQHTVTAEGTTVSLATVPSSGSGFVAVLDGSSAPGSFGLSRLAVTPVRYGSGGTVVAAAKTYVAVVQHPTENDVEVRDAATDALVRTLAKPDPYNFSKVTTDGDWAYVDVVGGHFTCRQPISRVRLDGSGKLQAAVPAAAGGFDSMAVGGPGGVVQAWIQSPCGGELNSQTIHWRNTATGVSGEIVTPSDPPQVSSLAVSPDGKQLSAYVRGGTQGNLELFNLASAQRVDQGSVPSACQSDGSYQCLSATYAPDGDLVLVRSDGQKLSVVRLHDGHTTALFSVSASSPFATIDMDPSGTQVLLNAFNGQSWLWSGGAKARALPASVLDASW